MSPLVVIGLGAVLAMCAWALAVRGASGADRVAIAVVLGLMATAFNMIVPIPNVEATTLVVVCTAVALGAPAAVLVGTIAVLGTSVTGGIGTWTAWQVVGYALVALLATAAGPLVGQASRLGGRVALASVIVVATVAYDVLLTVSTVSLLGASPAGGAWIDLAVSALLIGVPYTLTHVAGNVLLAWLAAPALLRALRRAGRRMRPSAARS